MAVTSSGGYKKRRQRSVHQVSEYQAMRAGNPTAVHSRPPQQLREDIHDGMDVLSVRQEVSKKFVMNHSLLENVTSKFFAADEIIPPKTFPEAIIHGVKYSATTLNEEEPGNKELLEREELILKSKLSNLLPGDISFGDIKLMKLKLKMLEEEISVLNSPQSSNYQFDAEFKYQVEKTEELTSLFGDSAEPESLAKHQSLISQITEQDYNSEPKFGKKVTEPKFVKQFSQPDLFGNKITEAFAMEERKKLLEAQAEKQKQQQQQQAAAAAAAASVHNTPQNESPFMAHQALPQSANIMTAPESFENFPGSSFSQQPPIALQQNNAPPTFQGSPQPSALIAQSQQQRSTSQSNGSQQSHDQAPVSASAQSNQQQPAASQQQSFANSQIDSFGIFPQNDKDIFGENLADEILIDDGTFNGIQSTLDDQIFFDHSMEL